MESKGEKLTYPYILRQRMIKEMYLSITPLSLRCGCLYLTLPSYDKYRDERPFEEFMSRIVSLVPHVTADALRVCYPPKASRCHSRFSCLCVS